MSCATTGVSAVRGLRQLKLDQRWTSANGRPTVSLYYDNRSSAARNRVITGRQGAG